MNNANGLPSLGIVGSINLASAFPRTFGQRRFYLSDTLSYSRSRHMIQMGGSLSRILNDVNIVGLGTLVQFLSWPDFLLGLNAQQNGTNLFSNAYASVDDYGLLDRQYRGWNGSLFIGDHYRATSTLILDLGLRYERIGQFGDALGRNSSFDISRADPNPPSGSSPRLHIGLRAPVQGDPPDSLSIVESAGTSWYNGLEASLNKQLSQGLQALASYTFSKALGQRRQQH